MPVTFPNETPEYRAARNELLELEAEADRLQGEVAKARRSLPLGGVVPEDYPFERLAKNGSIETVPMSQLFAVPDGPLIVYSMMFGPERETACPFCTAYLSNLDRAVGELKGKATFVVSARSPLPRLVDHAAANGWQNLVLVSDGTSSFHSDYGAMDNESDGDWPAFNVFLKDGDTVRHHWAREDGEDPTADGFFDPIDPAANLLALVP